MIALESVGKRYGSGVALHDVTFTVRGGEILGLLGPNGAGKTTTMRLVSGYTTATAGRVTVAGHDMASEHIAAAPLIGYLPERPPLYDALDVRGYLRFVAKAKGLRGLAVSREVARVGADCRLEAVLRRPLYQLSKGYRQRVGLAQALLGPPAVLLLDEPTIGLDPAQAHETRAVIRGFAAEHEDRAVLLSTHVLSEATQICHRIAIVDRGRLLAIDTPRGLARAVERTHRVRLRVGGAEPWLDAALRRVEGVRAVHVVRADEAPMELIEAVCEVDAAAPPVEAAIARAVIEGGAARELLHLEREAPSLEQVFLHYVRAAGRGR